MRLLALSGLSSDFPAATDMDADVVSLPVGELPAVLWTRILRAAVNGESSGPLEIHHRHLACLVRVTLPSVFAGAACPPALFSPATQPKAGRILMAPLLQASIACKKLALAAADLLGQPGTELVASLRASLDSRLLTNWAPLLHRLTVYGSLAVPGLAGFVHEAVQLETLRIVGLPPATAAELAQMFHIGSFSSITKLVCQRGHLPVDLPSRLQHLEVDFCRAYGQKQPADKLICYLSKSEMALQSLSIRLLDNNVLCSGPERA